jgi:hypothetical protein
MDQIPFTRPACWMSWLRIKRVQHGLFLSIGPRRIRSSSGESWRKGTMLGYMASTIAV